MTDDEENCSRLFNWAVRNGCTFQSLTISPHPHYGGLGLFNTTTTSPSSNDPSHLALSIPTSLIISIDTISNEANHSEDLAKVLNSLPELPTMEPIIAIFLCYQLSLLRTEKPSKWTDYIACLPQKTNLPTTWSTKELHFLIQSNSTISNPVKSKISFSTQIHSHLQQHSPPNSWFHEISLQDYLLSESWVSSRTIENTQSPILVPILDLANHRPDRNAAWEITPQGIELIREPVEITEGEEICISYDLGRGTGERLYRYGFLEDWREDSVAREVTLFDLVGGSRVQGGNVFRIGIVDVIGSFKDLSFLTYENWYPISCPLRPLSFASLSLHLRSLSLSLIPYP
jgi:hypothetical protein